VKHPVPEILKRQAKKNAAHQIFHIIFKFFKFFKLHIFKKTYQARQGGESGGTDLPGQVEGGTVQHWEDNRHLGEVRREGRKQNE
jgi:hypothetical protein